MLDDSFDASASMAALVLWLVFGYLSMMLNCDLQRQLQQHELVRHFLGYIAFYFLFTSLDNSNNASVPVTLVKTFLVYCVFVLATKSKWPFTVAMLTVLFIDQVLKNHINYLQKRGDAPPEGLIKARAYLFRVLLVVVGIGFVHYGFRQKAAFGAAFSPYKLVFTNGNCRM
jgi:hypothetical protein